MKIGQVEIDGRAALAPMAGVTDAAFRHICRAQGAALTYTEMVSSRGLVYNDAKTRQLLFCPPEDRPVAAQIFGSEPSIMAQAAGMAIELSGADILDINMGCPVGKIVKGGDGSALMPRSASRPAPPPSPSTAAPGCRCTPGWPTGTSSGT